MCLAVETSNLANGLETVKLRVKIEEARYYGIWHPTTSLHGVKIQKTRT
jgi:hypothetical protein